MCAPALVRRQGESAVPARPFPRLERLGGADRRPCFHHPTAIPATPTCRPGRFHKRAGWHVEPIFPRRYPLWPCGPSASRRVNLMWLQVLNTVIRPQSSSRRSLNRTHTVPPPAHWALLSNKSLESLPPGSPLRSATLIHLQASCPLKLKSQGRDVAVACRRMRCSSAAKRRRVWVLARARRTAVG